MIVNKYEKQLKDVLVSSVEYCDKCGEDVDPDDMYDAFKFDLTLTEGTNYPEGSSLEIKEMSLCNKCAIEAVKLLEANGFKTIKKELNY